MTSEPSEVAIPEDEVLRFSDSAEIAAWMFAIAAVLAGLLIVFTPAGNSAGLLQTMLGVAWIGFGLWIASGASAGITVGSRGVKVRSRLNRQTEYEWGEIGEFRLQRSLLRAPLHMRLENGREFRVVGLAAKNWDQRRRAEEMIAELNRRVVTARASGRSGSS